MSYPILSIDKDLAVYEREAAGWEKRGIGAVRVESICEAMQALSRGSFLFISINADNIEYMPMLSILTGTADAPVFIITSHFNIREQVEAFHNGAESYAPFQPNVEDNIICALALLHRYEKQSKHPRKKSKVDTYRELLILPRLRQVFCRDQEISLSKTEFAILLYLIANQGITVTFRQIYQRIWGKGYDETCNNAVWNHILRIRKKIAAATRGDSYIISVRGIGFRLSSGNDK